MPVPVPYPRCQTIGRLGHLLQCDPGHTTYLDLGAYEVIPGISGPAIPLTPGCEYKAFDNDGDTDQSDFAIVQRCYTGAKIPGDANCAN